MMHKNLFKINNTENQYNNILLNKIKLKKIILTKKLSLSNYNIKKLKNGFQNYKTKTLKFKNEIYKKKKNAFFKSITTDTKFDWSSFYKLNRAKAVKKKPNLKKQYLFTIFKKLKKKNNKFISNPYINIYLLYQDFFINKLINVLLLKKGRKYKAFNIFYKTLLLLKKITNISPIRIIKSLLKVDKMLVTYYVKKTRSKEKKIPKFDSKKNLYIKYLGILKKSLINLKISKHYTTSEKLAYVLITNMLNSNANWTFLIKDNVQSSKLYDQKRLLLYKKY